MPLGIRPLNDFAFKKIFGTPENRLVLISLLNAVLQPKAPIVEVTLENPFKPQDFHDDKLSVLDIKAVDRTGVIYDVEMQLTTYEGLVQRIVYYGCQLYAGQLKAGETHKILRPVYTIWLVNGLLWPDATRVHHVFRLADVEAGRVLAGTLELHTLELGRYNVKESELRLASMLDRWLYWLLHAHEYEPAVLLELLPQPAIRQATETLARIAQITEDKAMYDARESDSGPRMGNRRCRAQRRDQRQNRNDPNAARHSPRARRRRKGVANVHLGAASSADEHSAREAAQPRNAWLSCFYETWNPQFSPD